MSWTDIAEGRLTISDSEGNQMTFGAADMESVPAWVPRLPQSTQLASSYHTVENGKVTGAYMASTPMATADLVSFFAEQAQALGMESTLDTQHSAGTQEMRMIGYKQGDRGYSVNIVREGTGDANVQVMYEDVAGN